MKPFLTTSAGFAALALFACPEPKTPKEDPNVVAVVNGEPIPRAEFERELGRELQSVEASGPRTREQVEPFKQALLDTLVERRLLLQAAKAVNVSATPEEVDRRVLRLSSDFPAEGFEAALEQGQTSLAELKRQTAAQLTIEKLFESQVYARVAATEQELRQYFEEHPGEFEEPERVHASQIVVTGLDEARRIQQQLRQGKKFQDLARRYSVAPEAKVGGDLGEFARGVMPPEFDEVVFRLGVGQLSDVVSTEYGFHLFKVVGRSPAVKPEFAEVRPRVEEKVVANKRAQAQEAYVRALREKAEVRINQQVLLSVSGKAVAP